MHAQLCLSLCDSINCSPAGSSVHGIFQAGILGWVAISSSTLRQGKAHNLTWELLKCRKKPWIWNMKFPALNSARYQQMKGKGLDKV